MLYRKRKTDDYTYYGYYFAFLCCLRAIVEVYKSDKPVEVPRQEIYDNEKILCCPTPSTAVIYKSNYPRNLKASLQFKKFSFRQERNEIPLVKTKASVITKVDLQQQPKQETKKMYIDRSKVKQYSSGNTIFYNFFPESKVLSRVYSSCARAWRNSISFNSAAFEKKHLLSAAEEMNSNIADKERKLQVFSTEKIPTKELSEQQHYYIYNSHISNENLQVKIVKAEQYAIKLDEKIAEKNKENRIEFFKSLDFFGVFSSDKNDKSNEGVNKKASAPPLPAPTQVRGISRQTERQIVRQVVKETAIKADTNNQQNNYYTNVNVNFNCNIF